jgi:predicted transposase YbfD/YdcC
MKTKKIGFEIFFSTISDPRNGNHKRHLLLDIIILTILAVICNADSWESIEMFGRIKEKFLKKILRLPNGIPSHDTIQRVFENIDPDKFSNSFIEWIQALKLKKGLINMDGKTVRCSSDKNNGKKALHLVSAWAVENELVLGQIKTEDKSNEITAIPKLLDLLDIKGCIISIDAMGCQKAITEKIIEKKADYLIGLKKNQESLYEEVVRVFKDRPYSSYDKTIEKGHGRVETREAFVINDMEWLTEKEGWKDLKTIIKISSERWINGEVQKQNRYYICSQNKDAGVMNQLVRNHWGIENKLHWSLDVTYGEDLCRKRRKNAAVNFALIRKITLNILKRDPMKTSIRNKRLLASWDNKYLINALYL